MGAETNAEAVLKAQDIWFKYKNQEWVVKGITLSIPANSFFSIVGPSGAGKTTLLKVMAGINKPQRGSLELMGRDITTGLPVPFRSQIGYIPQQLGLVRSLTAIENVLMGSLGRLPFWSSIMGFFNEEEVKRAHHFLALVGIDHKANERAFHLSGGERQRVAIARTLLQKPRIVFADEFVSDLDVVTAKGILSSLKNIARNEGITFVFNMHELQLVQEFCDFFAVVKDGSMIYKGSSNDLKDNQIEAVMR